MIPGLLQPTSGLPNELQHNVTAVRLILQPYCTAPLRLRGGAQGQGVPGVGAHGGVAVAGQ